MEQRHNARGGSLIIVLILLVLLMAVGAGGFYVYQTQMKNQGPSKKNLPYTSMNDDLIRFTYARLPKLYASLAEINRQIGLIDKELARLASLESDYPHEERIIKTEKEVWQRLKKRLTDVEKSLEGKIEALFVTYSVNQEKGKEAIDNEASAMQQTADDVLQTARPETERIQIEQPKSFIDKLKARFFK
jgi:uncharacterized protein HemX